MTTRFQVTLLAVIGGSLLYLAGDWWWHGALRRQVEFVWPRASQVVARVHHTPVTRSQLERAMRERLWLEGKSLEELTPENRKNVRKAALWELIDHELLRVNAGSGAAELEVSAGEINERLERLAGCFDSPGAMAGAMKSQGIASERALRARLAARIQQEKYVESQLAPLARVTEAEVRDWFEANRRILRNPERVEVRHVFIATLDHPPEQARAKLAAGLADLTDGRKDFAALARELSEDPASSNHGGSLGWMTRERVPADFAAPVFALETNKPALVRTRLGWHLVEVTGRQPAQARTFEQAQAEIRAALEALKRRDAIGALRAALRQSAAAEIEVFE